MRSKLPLGPSAVFALVKELRAERKGDRPIAVGGARSLAEVLRRELGRDARPGSVEEPGFGEAAALVYVLAGPPTDEDKTVLRAADREATSIVCLAPEQVATRPMPYVLATDVIPIRPGEGFPLEEIGGLLARKLGEAGAPLAGRIPLLRPQVTAALTERFARRNGILGAAVFVPGADYPVLTINQIRLVLRIAEAYGHELGRERIPEILGVGGAGLGFRALARQLLGALPVAGWAVKGGIAYGGTRAVGEAATRYYEARRDKIGGGGT
jgi:uncharacterized protein (DUF697 family)